MTLLVVVALWALCVAIGIGTASLVLPSRWRHERVMLAPAFGAALLVVLAADLSYAGMTMGRAAGIIVVVALAISAFGLRRARDLRRLRGIHWRSALYANVLGLAAATSTVLSDLLHHAWNPYNDAFTYVSIAEYLQTHAYLDPVTPTATEPLLTQIWLYKAVGLRMGTNFLLAFVTALRRGDYAFDSYLPVLALGVWVAVPSFWVFCRRTLMLSQRACGLATFVYALHTGIPIINALWGFMPQAWGTAFLYPYLTLHIRAHQSRETLRAILAAALFGGVLLLTYTELVPFALVAVGAIYAVRLFVGTLRFRAALTSGFAPIVIGALLAPYSASTFVTAMQIQAGAVVGWDTQLSLFDYLGLLSGYRSVALSILQAPDRLGLACRLATVAATVTAAFAVFRISSRSTKRMAVIGLVFTAAVAWFALVASNPWQPGQIGQPWSTYKAVTYAFFLYAALLGGGLAALWSRGWLARTFVAVQVVVFAVYFVGSSVMAADVVSRDMRTLTGNPTEPIVEYKKLEGLVAGLPADQPVNLKIPDAAWRHRQLVAYFLRRPVIADWSADKYIGAYLPATFGGNLDSRFPTATFVTPGTAQSVARLQLVADTSSIVDTMLNDGWYAEERDGSNWWRWAEERGTMTVIVRRAGWLTMSADLAVVGAPQRTITVAFDGLESARRSYGVRQQWFAPFTTERLHVEPGSLVVTIEADGESTAMGPSDPRLIRFGLRNVRWTLSTE